LETKVEHRYVQVKINSCTSTSSYATVSVSTLYPESYTGGMIKPAALVKEEKYFSTYTVVFQFV